MSILSWHIRVFHENYSVAVKMFSNYGIILFLRKIYEIPKEYEGLSFL